LKSNPQIKTRRGNIAYRLRLLEKAQNNAPFQQELWQMCRRDMLFWVNLFVYTFDPRLIPKSTVVPFITYMFQDVTLDQISNAIDIGQDQGSEKSRDMGASWMYLIVYMHRLLFHEYQTFRLISETEDKVDKTDDPDCLFWKLLFILKHLPSWMKPRIKYNHLLLKNEFTDSTITGCSTTGDATRGGRCTSMLIDEMAAIRDADALMSSTQHVTNCRLYNSTHQGSYNAFYRKMNDGITPKMVLHWTLHPVKQRGLYCYRNGKLHLYDKNFRGKVRLYGTDTVVQFPEEYPFRLDGKLRSPWYDFECDRSSHPMEIAQELDMDPFASDSMFFSGEIIDRIKKTYCKTPMLTGTLEYDPDTLEPLEFIEQDGGPLRLWFMPGADGRPPRSLQAAAAFDISNGTGASNSTASVGDLITREKIAEYVNPWIMPESYGKMAVALAKWFNEAYMIWDGGGPGTIFSTVVVEAGYRNFYYQRAEDRLFNKATDKPGFFLNPDPKRRLLGAYRRALKEESFIQRSADAIDECMSYIYTTRNTVEHSAEYNNIDPSGAKSSHGDRVIADALLNKAFEVIKASDSPHRTQDRENCFAARSAKRLRKLNCRDFW
jgi:hypothetical protein